MVASPRREQYSSILPTFAWEDTLPYSHLLAVKKFRKRGNKDGALRAFYKLEGEQLGTVLELNSAKGGSQKVSALMPPLKYLCNPFLSAI